MKATPIRVIHRTACEAIFKPAEKRRGVDCSSCRHSSCQPDGRKWAFVCSLKHSDMNARTCPDFKDARHANPLNAMRVL